jgi:hypothetical protein
MNLKRWQGQRRIALDTFIINSSTDKSEAKAEECAIHRSQDCKHNVI